MEKSEGISGLKNPSDVEAIQRNWIIAGGLFIIFILFCILMCVVFFILNTHQWSELLEKKIEYITRALTVTGLIFGGIVGAINVYFGAKRAFAMENSAVAANKTAEAALKNAEAANKTADANFKNAQVSEDKQITERFSKAIEQLGSEKIEVRLGGIYTLERIAKDSEKDHWTIMEVLTAFIRENAPVTQKIKNQPSKTFVDEFLNNEIEKSSSTKNRHDIEEILKLRLDIQESLTVIARRNHKNDTNILNLFKTNIIKADLYGANLQGANLQGANLIKANLQEAKLQGAYLQKANLQEAHLYGANFQGANLQGANLLGTKLQKANLQKADLQRAYLQKANLEGTNLEGANLQGANFQGANLQGANLEEANLKGTNLQGANLQGANLVKAQFINSNQIKKANYWEAAKYSEVFSAELGLPPKNAE